MKTHEYQGYILESDEELYFAWWCEELKQKGMINTWSKSADSIVLTNPLKKEWTKITPLKTKVKEERKTQTIMKGSSYTPDFWINWEIEALNIFYQVLDCEDKITCPFISDSCPHASVVEVKPSFDQNNMTREFMIKQKFIYEYLGMYVNLIIPQVLFKKTFTPERYLLTDAGRQKRKITKWKPTTFEDYYLSKTKSVVI